MEVAQLGVHNGSLDPIQYVHALVLKVDLPNHSSIRMNKAGDERGVVWCIVGREPFNRDIAEAVVCREWRVALTSCTAAGDINVSLIG